MEKIKLDRKKAHQRYKLLDGTVVPGGSTIAKVAMAYQSQGVLMTWANKQGIAGIDINKDKQAMDVGTLAHFLTDCYITKKEADLSNWSPDEISLAETATIKFGKWWDDNELKSILNEEQMVSQHYRFGGTIDNVVEFPDGKRWLIDKKTSTGIYPEAFVQVAGYRQLLIERDIVVDAVAIVRIGKESDMDDFEVKEVVNTDKYWNLFKLGLDLYQAYKEIKIK